MQPTLIDDLGRQVALRAPPGRIVSLVPSLTEAVCILGRGDQLVGVTRFCTEPADIVGGLPKVGGTKNPDLARIIELRPELVLVNAEENRAEDFQALSAAGLILFVSFPRDLESAAASLQRLGAVLDTSEIADHIAADLRQARLYATAAVRVFCPIWRKPWMSFNRDTYPHDVLSCAGAHNVCAEFDERYPIVELADIARFDPEVVLLPDEPYPFAERHRGVLSDLRKTSAWRNDRVHFVDGKMLFWYGPRTSQGVRYLRELLAAP